MAFGSASSVFREWNVMTLQVSGTSFTGLDSDAAALEALPVSEDEEEGAEMLDPHEGD